MSYQPNPPAQQPRYYPPAAPRQSSTNTPVIFAALSLLMFLFSLLPLIGLLFFSIGVGFSIVTIVLVAQK